MSTNQVSVAAGRGQKVSIADILNRQVALDWFESVAIVAGLCSALGERQAAAMPALDDIHLTPAGAIALAASGAQADDAVLRLLHDCLRLAAHPPALRLFVLNALSSDRHRSPAALEEALAYYERPGRAAIIQGVRARCLAASDAPVARADAANGSSNFEVDKAADARSAAVASTRRRRVLAVGVTVCAVCVAAVVTLVYSRGLSAGNIGNMQGLAGYVAETGRGLVKAVTETLNLTPQAPAMPATADATSAGPGKKPRRARASVTSASSGQPASIGETTAIADSKASQVVLDETLAAGPGTVEAPPASAPEVAPANPAAVVGTDEIMPPRLIDPVRLPRWAYVATNRSSHVIELAITETGKVDRVRLVSPAVRMTDMMMLSAAKTWTFEPARQDGHPTPYTLMLNVAGTAP
jgi:hypothetical protein